jgi:hypothetical protein
MSVKLNDEQRKALSAAAERADHCIAIPVNLKVAGKQKLAAKMIAAGFAKEIKAKADTAVWRHDEDTGQAFALKLTAAGLKAVADENNTKVKTESEYKSPASSAVTEVTETVATPAAVDTAVSVSTAAAPRVGSKLATVLDLLQRKGGATIAELSGATNWLPHTTRAALTGLRKRGYDVGRSKARDQRASAYVIAESARAAAQ